MRAGDGPSLRTMIVGVWPAKAILNEADLREYNEQERRERNAWVEGR